MVEIVFVSGPKTLAYDPGEDFGLPVTYTPVTTAPRMRPAAPRNLVKIDLLRVRVHVPASLL